MGVLCSTLNVLKPKLGAFILFRKPGWLSEQATGMHLPDSLAAPELFPGSGHTCALLPWLGGGCPTGREQVVCEQWAVLSLGHRGRGAELICAWAVLLSSAALCAVCSDPCGLSQGQEAGVLGASMFLNCSLGPLFCWQKLSKTGAQSGL